MPVLTVDQFSILKFCPPNSLDSRAHYKSQTRLRLLAVLIGSKKPIKGNLIKKSHTVPTRQQKILALKHMMPMKVSLINY